MTDKSYDVTLTVHESEIIECLKEHNLKINQDNIDEFLRIYENSVGVIDGNDIETFNDWFNLVVDDGEFEPK